MKALILAGGYGTRLGKLGEMLPKPLLPLNEKMRVIDYIVKGLESFVSQEDMIIVTNEKFRGAFEKWARDNGFRGKIIAEPHRKNEEKFGTIKGMRWAIEAAKIEEDVLVIASDNVVYPFEEFLERMLSLFDSNRAVVGAYEAGIERIRKRFGNLKVVDGGKVVEFVEKPEDPISPYAAMAIYIFPRKLGEKSLLEVLDEYLENGNPDAPGHFIAYLVGKGYPLYGNIFSGKWWDVGKVEDWQSAMKFFESLREEF